MVLDHLLLVDQTEETGPPSWFSVQMAGAPPLSTGVNAPLSVATEMKYFDTETKSWKPFSSPWVRATRCICAEVVGNYLYLLIDEGSYTYIMYRYHMVRNNWEKLPCFQNYLIHKGCMSSVNEYIYVINDLGVPQRYSLAQNDWQSGSKMPSDDQEILDKAYLTAVSMGSKIYVLHGCYHREEGTNILREKPAVVHCFDPLKNVWLKKASTLYPHFDSTLFVDNNKLYVAGGWVSVPNQGSPFQDSFFLWSPVEVAPVEIYNEESNSWSVVEQNRIPSNTLGAVELLGGKVYFIINKFPIDSGIRIPPNEVYKISLREWENSLEKIDRTAVLCYMSVKKEMLSTV